MGRIKRLSKPAVKKQQHYLPSTNLCWEVLRAKLSYRCWECSNGKVKVSVHKQITENWVSGEGKQNETQGWVLTQQLLSSGGSEKVPESLNQNGGPTQENLRKSYKQEKHFQYQILKPWHNSWRCSTRFTIVLPSRFTTHPRVSKLKDHSSWVGPILEAPLPQSRQRSRHLPLQRLERRANPSPPGATKHWVSHLCALL